MREAGLHARVLVLPLDEPDGMAGLSGCSDMIVLSHVLEHVFDVRSTIASLLDILTPEGRLYIEVSDPARYDAAAYPPFYFFDSEHINHLDEVALRNLASMVGLAVEKIGKKFITLQNGSAYPAKYGTLVRTEIPPQSGFSAPDLGRTLAGYIEDSKIQLETLRGRLQELLGNAEHFAVWGAGSYSQRLLSQDWFPRDRLLAIVDRDGSKVGLKFMGMTIQSPETGLRELPSGTLVLCAAAIAGDEIARDYGSLKLPYILLKM